MKIIAPPAIRFISEDSTVRVIEGLGFPMRSRDSYNTWFSPRTDFFWSMFADVEPGSRSAPGFVRPLTYEHGFDKDIGLTRLGGWSPIRMDADGVWIRAAIDKAGPFYASRIGPLLDAKALGLSGGSAEHSVRIDQKSGEILAWPAYELAITTIESNPLAVISTRSVGELHIVPERLRIVDRSAAA